MHSKELCYLYIEHVLYVKHRLPLWLSRSLQWRRCGFNSWVRKISGGGHGNPIQYSCLGNPMDRGAWRATVHWVTKSCTRLKWLSIHVKHISNLFHLLSNLIVKQFYCCISIVRYYYANFVVQELVFKEVSLFLVIRLRGEFRIWLLLWIQSQDTALVSLIVGKFFCNSFFLWTHYNYSLVIFWVSVTRIMVAMKKDITKILFWAWIWCFGESGCLYWRSICVRVMNGNVVATV